MAQKKFRRKGYKPPLITFLIRRRTYISIYYVIPHILMWGFTPILPKENLHKYLGVPLRKSGVWGSDFLTNLSLFLKLVKKLAYPGNAVVKKNLFFFFIAKMLLKTFFMTSESQFAGGRTTGNLHICRACDFSYTFDKTGPAIIKLGSR